MNSKRQNQPSLSVVATPIGNLGDLSARAIEIFRKSDGILAEDTRRIKQLLSSFGINEKKVERFDAHATEKDIVKYVTLMKEGESWALATDAGTPGVSDPGAELVKACYEEGLVVSPVPGPSAVTALVSVAGFIHTQYLFKGYFPRKNAEKIKELENCIKGDEPKSVIWFESPERIEATLQVLFEFFRNDSRGHRIAIGKEITKQFEWVYAGNSIEVERLIKEKFIDPNFSKGEWVFGIEFQNVKMHEQSNDLPPYLVEVVGMLVDAGVAGKEIAKRLASVANVDRSLLYQLALEKKQKK